MAELSIRSSEHRGSPLRRAAIAFLIAPGAGAVAGGILSVVPFSFGHLGGLFYSVLATYIGIFVAYPIALIAGVPTFIIFRRLRIRSLPSYLLVGLLLGVAGWVAASSPIPNSGFYYRAAAEGFFALVSGLAGAVVFWSLAVYGDNP